MYRTTGRIVAKSTGLPVVSSNASNSRDIQRHIRDSRPAVINVSNNQRHRNPSQSRIPVSTSPSSPRQSSSSVNRYPSRVVISTPSFQSGSSRDSRATQQRRWL
jgi:hypothetical protein